jgi:glycosyltransferase involved in cell wall biosynthesis
LFVGNRGLYKNFYVFARAVAAVTSHYPELRLVCLGGGKFSRWETKFFKIIGLDGRVSSFPADDPTLVQAYKNAMAFVYPSLYEGFGIPILEAFACECPVVCSRTSCFPEIAGDAALYFDPKDFRSIKAALLQILGDKGLRENMRAQGYLRVQRYSWEKSARETLAVYQSVA